MKGLEPHAESGVKKGDESEEGLVGPAENDEGAVSVKTLDREVLLCDWKGRRRSEKLYVSGLSVLRFSSLFLPDNVAVIGDIPPGEVGERAPGVCALDGGFEAPSDSSAMDPFLDFAPMRWFFCLNFSSQLVLLALRWLSEFPTVCAKKRALSRMMASVKGSPCLWWFLAQFESARSMSGNLPLDLLIGDRLPSSWYKYFSFWRKTLETVLVLLARNMNGLAQMYLLSTPNIASLESVT
jgi:hypothetical protein